jgi:extracellular elastinolytic metalloproteinase
MSDTISWLLTMNETHTRDSARVLFQYTDKNARRYPISTIKSVNPLHYSFVENGRLIGYRRWDSDIHYTGEIWSVLLYEVYWRMVEKSGFTSDFNESPRRHGNTRFLQILVDSLKLLPCRPTFVMARNAFLYADSMTFDGLYYCEIWRGFAVRGLGESANDGRRKRIENAFDVPRVCGFK